MSSFQTNGYVRKKEPLQTTPQSQNQVSTIEAFLLNQLSLTQEDLQLELPIKLFRIINEFRTKCCQAALLNKQEENQFTEMTNCKDCSCQFAHSILQLRRSPFNEAGRLSYLPILCPQYQPQSFVHIQQEHQQTMNNQEQINDQHIQASSLNTQMLCNHGSSCLFCINESELQYHPLQYKTKICQNQQIQCQSSQSDLCSNAHSQQELRVLFQSNNNGNVFQRNQQDDNQNQEEGIGSNSGGDKGSFKKKSKRRDSNQTARSLGSPKKHQQKYSNQHSDISSMDSQIEISLGGERIVKNDQRGGNANSGQYCSFLDLTLFKVFPCKQDSNSHNLKRCPYYHDQKKDQRRNLGTYQSEICQNAQKGIECPNGDSCQKAHNRVEEFYHPDKYKAKFCSSYIDQTGECEYGEYCSFAHSEAEISVELIDQFEQDFDFYMFHFKSVWCPYNESKHERKACVYAHNWQDFRRKPQLYLYSKEQCMNWGSKSFISSYKDGCSSEFKCLHSHGWKEQEYHPDNYKLNPCRNGESCNKIHCPYFHNESDRRSNLQQWFKLFPKSRIINFSSNYYMPYLRNLTVNQDMMGGLKQTSFSRTTTEISFNSFLNRPQTPTQQYQQQQQIQQQVQSNTPQPHLNNHLGGQQNKNNQMNPQQQMNSNNMNLNAPNFVPKGQQKQNQQQNFFQFYPIPNSQRNSSHSHQNPQHANTLQKIGENPYSPGHASLSSSQSYQEIKRSATNYSQQPQFYMQIQQLDQLSNLHYQQQLQQQQTQNTIQDIKLDRQQISSNNSIIDAKKRGSLQPQIQRQVIIDQNLKRFSLQPISQQNKNYLSPIKIIHQDNIEDNQSNQEGGASSSNKTNSSHSVYQQYFSNIQQQQQYQQIGGINVPISKLQQYEERKSEQSPDKLAEFYKSINNSEPKKRTLPVFTQLHDEVNEQDEHTSQSQDSQSGEDDEDDEESDSLDEGENEGDVNKEMVQKIKQEKLKEKNQNKKQKKELKRFFKKINLNDQEIVEKLEQMKLSVKEILAFNGQELHEIFNGKQEIIEIVNSEISKYEMEKNVLDQISHLCNS